MTTLLNLGKYLFVLSFLLYVGLHFGLPEKGAEMIPDWIPAPLFMNYLTGVLILAFIVSCLVGRYDKLAALLMALYVLLMIVLIHIPQAATSENDMLNIFRNLMVVGALLMYARFVARDARLTP